MTTTALRNKLIKRIQKEEDEHILRSIEILLRSDTKEDVMRRRLAEMTIRSEEAIKKGEVVSIGSAKRHSKKVLKEISERRSK